MRVRRACIHQCQLALRDPRLRCEQPCGVQYALPAERRAERVDRHLVQVCPVRRVDVEHGLNGIGDPRIDRSGVEREPHRVVPRGAVEPDQTCAVEHVRDSLDGADLSSGVPRARVALGREAAGVDLGRGEGRRRRLGVERVAIARLAGRQNRRLQVRGQQGPRSAGSMARSASAGQTSSPTMLKRPANGLGIPPKESQGDPAASAASRCVASSGVRVVGPLPPSTRTRPERSFGARAPVEVPGRIGRRDRSSEGVAAEHDLAAVAACLRDDASQVFDRDFHSPVATEGDVSVGDGLEVVGDAGIREKTEVVLEVLPRRGLSALHAVQHANGLRAGSRAAPPSTPASRASGR